jgi:hypothetical protein
MKGKPGVLRGLSLTDCSDLLPTSGTELMPFLFEKEGRAGFLGGFLSFLHPFSVW